MDAVLQNLRYSIRTFRKAPGFAVVAVLAVAFGIGVNSAIFTLLNGLALRPLPVKNPSEVVTVYQTIRGLKSRYTHGSRAYLSYPEYKAYRDQNHVFSGLAAYALARVTLGGPEARTVQGQLVSCNYFPALTGSLTMGRGFLPEECGAPGGNPVVVLSRAFWQGQFGGDPQILGKTVVLNRGTFTVVGVGPEGFSGGSVIAADVWTPISMQEQWIQDRTYLTDANLSWLEVAGRLKPGMTVADARADLAVIAGRVDGQTAGRKTTLFVDRATLMNNPEGRGPVLSVGAVVLAAVSLILLIACANLANLLLARAVARQKEIAVRLAVGATRARLIGQLLTESLVMALSGGVLGLLLAWWTLRSVIPAIVARLPEEVHSIAVNLNPDFRIVLYSMLLALATGVGFGLIPALQSSKVDLNSALKEGGVMFGARSGGWLRGSLVTVQVAVCLVLLIAAGLLARGLRAAQTIDPGFELKGVAFASFDLRREGYDETRATVFHRQLAERLASQPGVEEVGFVDSVPLSGTRRGTFVSIEGRDGSQQVNTSRISANYFQLLGVPILRGRAFESRAEEHVVVVNESAARRFWPGENPVGKHIRYGDEKVYSEVVGVVKDTHTASLSEVDGALFYLPVVPRSRLELSILVRGNGGFAAMAKAIRNETRALDSSVLVRPGRLEDNLSLWQLPARITSTLAFALGMAGLLLASLGIYGVIAFAVTQRTREIGIRMTLGAQRRDVLELILAQAMRPVAVGVAVGVAGTAIVSRVLSSLLFGVSPLDPAVFAGVSMFLASIALLAAYVPALRATRVDPNVALRQG
jgi:predicted permease